MKCAIHPGTETDLKCGKCEQPICPKCLVQTPVGARCPTCAAVKRLPTFDVPAKLYARAIVVGVLTASVLGAIWPFIPLGGFLVILIGAGIGYVIGEIISRAVNRKCSPGLQVIAGVSVGISYLIRGLIIMPSFGFLVASLLNISGLLALVIGVTIAVGRLRFN
ncbi:MAG: B-box zinc finger protein [Chloroflexota bacterium]|nr:B-box zinc finger protein [Chloroflexota bacterium]